MIANLRDRILLIKLQGQITSEVTKRLHDNLNISKFYNVQLIAVTINSCGGSIIQAKNIQNALRGLSQQTSAPVYTFAEDVCLNSANIILTSGNKCFASRFSLLGDLSYTYQGLGFQKLLNGEIEQQYLYQGKDKIRFNPFQNLNQKDVDWMKNILLQKEFDLRTQVIANRANKFEYLKLSNEQINQNILEKSSFDANHALKNGLIDGITLFEDLANEMYTGVQVYNVEECLRNKAIKYVKNYFEKQLLHY